MIKEFSLALVDE